MNTKKINVKPIVDKTTGFSGAEIKATCVEAGMIAIRQGRGLHYTRRFYGIDQTN